MANLGSRGGTVQGCGRRRRGGAQGWRLPPTLTGIGSESCGRPSGSWPPTASTGCRCARSTVPPVRAMRAPSSTTSAIGRVWSSPSSSVTRWRRSRGATRSSTSTHAARVTSECSRRHWSCRWSSSSPIPTADASTSRSPASSTRAPDRRKPSGVTGTIGTAWPAGTASSPPVCPSRRNGSFPAPSRGAPRARRGRSSCPGSARARRPRVREGARRARPRAALGAVLTRPRTGPVARDGRTAGVLTKVRALVRTRAARPSTSPRARRGPRRCGRALRRWHRPRG